MQFTFCIARTVALLAVLTLFIPVYDASAQIATYMVGIMNHAVYEGEVAQVVWLAPWNRTETKGWVGIFPVGASDRNTIAWQYIDPTKEYGYIRFEMKKAGDYEVRLFSTGYTRVAQASGIVRVRPDSGPGSFSGSYRLEVEESRVTTTEPIRITWRLPWDQAKSQHWVGLYERGAEDRAYTTWTYISPGGDISGTTDLRTTKPGRYEVRLFKGSGYERVAELKNAVVVREGISEPSPSGTYRLSFDRITVLAGDRVNVSWTAPSGHASRDWIGLYTVGASDRQYRTWEYVGAGSSGSVTFTAPSAGTYEARYFLDNGYTRVGGTANRLRVQ